MFYKTLETQISGLPKLEPIKTEKPEEFASILREFLDYILKNVDYEAIFQKSIFDEIPFPRKLCEALNEFIEELGTYNWLRFRAMFSEGFMKSLFRRMNGIGLGNIILRRQLLS